MQGTSHEECHKVLDQTLHKCNAAGFRIEEISCNGKNRGMMEKIQDKLDVGVNFANVQDHKPKAERNNRTIKEGFRTAFHQTPHSTMPRLTMQELAELTTKHLNCFPAKHGMSKCCSPHVIVNQEPIDCNKHCKHSFGECVQAHHQNDPAQTMAERTIDAVHLWPNSNRQGGHRVMSLHTGKPIT